MQLIVGFVAMLVVLATADAMLMVQAPPLSALMQIWQKPEVPSQPEIQEPATEEPTVRTPDGGVPKTTGPDVRAVLERFGFVQQQTNELLLLRELMAAEETGIEASALLVENDRAGAIAWVETPKVKVYFLALKEALHGAFTPELTDLVDETQHVEGRPPRNILTFLDPGISEERIAFFRVREQLYEVHMAKEYEAELFAILDELSQ